MGQTQTYPPEVEGVFREFRTCELTTINKNHEPIVWPVTPFLTPPQTHRFLFTTSIGFPQKALNIRRNPKVSIFFSDPTASGLVNPPVVLVQGDAEAPHEIHTTFPWPGLEVQLRKTMRKQPLGSKMLTSPLMRYLTDWYYMRLYLWVTPRKVIWWENRDLDCKATASHELVV